MYITNDDNSKTIENDTAYNIQVKKMDMSKRKYEKCLGAKADEQVLYTDSEMKVTLQGLGYIERNTGNKSISANLRIENLTNKKVLWKSSGFIINGIFFENTVQSDISPKRIDYKELYEDNLTQLDWKFENYLFPGFDGIESVKIVFASNKDLKKSENALGTAIPVKLSSSKKTKNQFVQGKHRILKAKGLDISYIGTFQEGGEKDWKQEWYFSVTNNSKNNMLLDFENFRTNKLKKGMEMFANTQGYKSGIIF